MLSFDHFITAGISLLFYSCLNVSLSLTIKIPSHLDYKQSRDFIGQHISFVHSMIACILSLGVYLLNSGIDYESDFSFKYILVLGHSMGYFTYDMIYAEIFGVHDLAMRFHHVCVLIGGYTLYCQDKGGAIGVLCVGLTELSNPSMQTRLILKSKKMQESNLYKIAESTFAFIFTFNRYLIFRGVIGTFLNYNVYQYDVNYVLRIFVSLIYGVSLYWVFVIFCMVNKKLRKRENGAVISFFVKIMNALRENSFFVIAGIFTWSIFMPPTLKMLGFSPYHLRVSGFTII
jgi:hypothetical protein